MAQFPNQGKMAAGRAQTQRGTCMHRGTAEARTGAWVRVCAVCVTESKRKKTRRGRMDGKERDTRGKCQDLSPCLVFIRAQEARAHTESSKEPGGHWAPPDQEDQRCRGGCWVFLHSIWSRLLRARRSSSFRPRSRCRHPTLPRPARLSSYHRAPSPHHQAPARVSCCTKLHLGCQGSPSQGPPTAQHCVFAIVQLTHQGCARARHS